jgi:cytochrome c peroxidase
MKREPPQTAPQEPTKEHIEVPSLRNIEKTGPYSHNGSVASLAER